MWHPLRTLVPSVLVVTGACGTGPIPSAPAPPPPPPAALGPPCSPTDTVRIAALSGVTLDCSAGTTITLAGNGAAYLVVPELGAGGIGTVDYAAHGFSLSVGGETTNLAPAAAASARAPRRASAQTIADRAFMRRAARLASRVARSGLNPGVRAAPAAPPVLGSGQSFHVAASATTDSFTTVTATLRYIGANVFVYVDDQAPTPGFTDAQLAGFGQLTDQVLMPLLTGAFGSVTDVDGNGHVIVLITPAVNALVPFTQCQTQGYVGGFFDGTDFTADPNSNRAEIFYALAPDPLGTKSCIHSVATVTDVLPAILLHEMQHMISFGRHVLVNQGAEEEGWLDEGLSMVAEELGARYYEAKYPPPSGRTNTNQVFPDSAQKFIADKLVDSYYYLLQPDTVSLTLHTDSDDGLDWRAGDWLLLRYLGDRFGPEIFRTLEDASLTGPANLAAATGLPLSELLANFGVALYTDSLPGIPRTSIPARYRFQTRNLRFLYQAVYNGRGPQGGIPVPFPITVHSFTPNGGQAGSLVPGAVTFYGLLTASGTAAVSLQFGLPAGGTLAAALHPQVSVFRVK